MVPEYTKEDFVIVTEANGETYVQPADCYSEDDANTTETITGKWWARLSAPGYMDATEWSGPFDTRAEAAADLASQYDVDPETGDDAEEDDSESEIGTGYVDCGCRDCFEIAIGKPGTFCHECVTAGCEPDSECCAEGAYGGDTEDDANEKEGTS